MPVLPPKPSTSGGAIGGLPILGVRIDLGKTLRLRKQEQLIEIGKRPEIGGLMSLSIRRIAAQMEAAQAPVNNRPRLIAASLSSSQAVPYKCLRQFQGSLRKRADAMEEGTCSVSTLSAADKKSGSTGARVSRLSQ